MFLLFLDCVSQLRRTFPGSFQFSDVFLVHVWDALNSGMFGTFAFNSPRDSRINSVRMDDPVTVTTTSQLLYLFPSAWDWRRQFSDSQISLMQDPLYIASRDLDVSAAVANGGPPRRGITVTGDGFQLPVKRADVQLWSLCYLRWLTPVMITGGGQACEYLTQCLLVEEIVELQQQISEFEQATDGGDKRQSVLIFGPGRVTADLVHETASARLAQRVSSSFPFVPRHSADETPSSLSQVPSLDTYLESSLLGPDRSSLYVTDDSASASLCDDAVSD